MEFLAEWSGRISALLFGGQGLLQFADWTDSKARFQQPAEVSSVSSVARLKSGASNWLGLAGCLCLAIHTLIAFAGVYAGRHDLAYVATARQTMAATGVNWGGGYYLNYVTWVLWCLQVWLASRGPTSAGARLVERACWWWVSGMMFCATVVFGPSGWTALAVGYGLVMLAIWRSNRAGSRKEK